MKKVTIASLLLIFITALVWFNCSASGKRIKALCLPKSKSNYSLSATHTSKLKTYAAEAKLFTKNNSYNDKFCILIDMNLPSYQKRFFVYDLVNDAVKNSGLVAHGRCNKNWLEGRKYSNEVGCGCTSLGRYKIGNAYNGTFGLAFKLHGLDKTNSNAFKRFVVLHAHSCVPETEVSSDICQSDGCTTVAPGFLKEIEPLIKESNKPVLLWVLE